jgi:hypothetical protein
VSGQIHYPEGEGTLLYVKTAVLASDSEDLRQYNRGHAAFPHETTRHRRPRQHVGSLVRALITPLATVRYLFPSH